MSNSKPLTVVDASAGDVPAVLDRITDIVLAHKPKVKAKKKRKIRRK